MTYHKFYDKQKEHCSIMATPQKENGYTTISNEIMDALVAIRIPGEARQCLDYIIRQTYGWGKKLAPISTYQFVVATGQKRESVYRSIKKLLAMNLINKKATSDIPIYCFQKNYKLWKSVAKKLICSKKATVSSSNDTNGRVAKKRRSSIRNKVIIKDKKEIIIKKKFDQVKFDEFYLWYPRKKSKKTAIDAFKKIDMTNELFEQIMRSLCLDIASKQWKDEQHIPYPATWLNQKRWEDSHDKILTKTKDQNTEKPKIETHTEGKIPKWAYNWKKEHGYLND
jgi:phage replication O-like protein O